MYVGYTNSFSVSFFCTIEFLCMKVEQNIWNVNILLTCADDRNDNKTSTFMDGGRGNAIESRVGAWLNGLAGWDCGPTRHSRSHWGCCSTRTGPKYVRSSVCTESLCMYVGYTNSFSIRFFVNTYDIVHIVLIKIHIIFTIAYNTYWTCGGLFFLRNP